MLKKIALATALLSSLGTAYAYQAEINAGYENTDGDIDTFVLNGKYYLNNVSTQNVPFAEAGFLNKASNIGAGYANVSADADEDLDVYGVNAEYYVPNTNFYVSAALNRIDLAGYKNTGYAVEGGYFPIDNLLVAVGVAKENVDPVQVANYGVVANLLNAVSVGDDTAVSLRAKYVTQVAGYTTNFEGLSYIGDETTYRLGADLYIDPTLSVGVSFADSTADGSDTIFSIGAKKFFTPQIAVGAAYTNVDSVDAFGLNGTYRF